MVVHISTLTVTVLVEPCIVEPRYMATQTHTPGVSILKHVQNLTAQFCLVKIVHFPTNCMNTNAIRNPKPLHTDRASRTYTVLCQNASWLTCCTVLRLRESLHSTGVCLPAVCFLNVCKSFSDNSGLFCNWKGVLKWGQQPIKMLTLCFSSCTKKSLIRAIKKQALKEFRNLLLKKKSSSIGLKNVQHLLEGIQAFSDSQVYTIDKRVSEECVSTEYIHAVCILRQSSNRKLHNVSKQPVTYQIRQLPVPSVTQHSSHLWLQSIPPTSYQRFNSNMSRVNTNNNGCDCFTKWDTSGLTASPLPLLWISKNDSIYLRKRKWG